MNNTPATPPRWKQRFDSFHRALELLCEAIAMRSERTLTPLELEGTVQRFEYTLELAWKTVADYLTSQGTALAEITPRRVVRAAAEAGILTDIETWMDALDDRNKMTHTYDFAEFERISDLVASHYVGLFNNLDSFFVSKMQEKLEEMS